MPSKSKAQPIFAAGSMKGKPEHVKAQADAKAARMAKFTGESHAYDHRKMNNLRRGKG
jgi:hypothetical protein